MQQKELSGAVRVTEATPADREKIYELRHDAYARELGQHRLNDDGRLTDALEETNTYLVARVDGDLAGFVSVTGSGW